MVLFFSLHIYIEVCFFNNIVYVCSFEVHSDHSILFGQYIKNKFESRTNTFGHHIQQESFLKRKLKLIFLIV